MFIPLSLPYISSGLCKYRGNKSLLQFLTGYPNESSECFEFLLSYVYVYPPNRSDYLSACTQLTPCILISNDFYLFDAYLSVRMLNILPHPF